MDWGVSGRRNPFTDHSLGTDGLQSEISWFPRPGRRFARGAAQERGPSLSPMQVRAHQSLHRALSPVSEHHSGERSGVPLLCPQPLMPSGVTFRAAIDSPFSTTPVHRPRMLLRPNLPPPASAPACRRRTSTSALAIEQKRTYLPFVCPALLAESTGAKAREVLADMEFPLIHKGLNT